MSRKSILKPLGLPDANLAFPFASCPNVHLNDLTPHVHFPPTPGLVSTHEAHSPSTYDRAPIVVAPNSCALPRRGDRVYTPAPERRHTADVAEEGGYFVPHPCALDSHYSSLAPPPYLVHDLSSSSSESDVDDAGASLGDTMTFYGPVPLDPSHAPIPRRCSEEDMVNYMSFLPYPPAPNHDIYPSPKRKRRESKYAPCTAFAAPLDGCLGGF
jgi:hypothetical protein